MADLVLPSVFQVITDKLTSFVLEKLGSLLDFKDDVKKLQRTLPMVQAILEDAEEKQVTNLAVRIWLSKLQDIAYDTEVLLLQLSADSSFLHRKYADEVKDVLVALEKAADEGLGLNLTKSVRVDTEWDRKETSSFVIESEVYGRDDDKEKIVKLLLSSEAMQGGGTVLCIPIIGMGGLGKTTLAQLAFNDQKVIQHFDEKVWIFVSYQFDVKNILITIIESITEAKWELSAMDAAHKKVRKLLQNKRYLIVIDNVWTEYQDDWDRLRQVLFGTGIHGSRILITTRSRKVEEALSKTGFPTIRYGLDKLSDEANWSLFKHRAFQRGEEEKHLILLSIGEQIVRKCGGLPLAAKTLGSLMRYKRNVKEWEFVRDSELWNLDECESGILPALRLSYSRLPLHLKRCLAFCSIFPRNYEFKKEKLIHLWMAQGLIQCKSKKIRKEKRIHQFQSTLLKEPEDVGNEYFTDLEWLSLLQETKENGNGVVNGHKMHDIIYDLLQSITSTEYTIQGYGFETPTSFKRIRHLSVICDFNSSTISEDLYEAGHHLRTLLLFSEGNLEVLSQKFCSSFTCLFALNLGGSGLIKLESSIGALSHLTYLDLSHTLITKLPPEIEGLSSLQTLNLFNCHDLLALPNLTKMKRLRHLNNEGCRRLTQMLDVEGKRVFLVHYQNSDWYKNLRLSKRHRQSMQHQSHYQRQLKLELQNQLQLQTLPLFVLGGDDDLTFLELLMLRGSVKITHLERIDHIDVPLRFHHCNGIESLGLYWGSDDGCPNINPEGESIVNMFQERKQTESSSSSQGIQHDPLKGQEVLKGIVPPRSLKRLLIKRYQGFKFPSWDLPYLVP